MNLNHKAVIENLTSHYLLFVHLQTLVSLLNLLVLNYSQTFNGCIKQVAGETKNPMAQTSLRKKGWKKEKNNKGMKFAADTNIQIQQRVAANPNIKETQKQCTVCTQSRPSLEMKERLSLKRQERGCDQRKHLYTINLPCTP